MSALSDKSSMKIIGANKGYWTNTDISKNDLSNSISQMWGFDRELVTNKGIYTWLDIARMYKAVYEKLLG